MGRKFNTAGPCFPEDDYMLPASERLPEAAELVRQKGYFAVHAPRQTGKTTAIRALAQELTASGAYAALAFSCEAGSAYLEDIRGAQAAIIEDLGLNAQLFLPPNCAPRPPPLNPEPFALRCRLGRWSARDRWCCSSTRSTHSKAPA